MWKSRWSRPDDLQSRRERRRRRPLLEGLEARRLLATNITQYHVDTQSTGANLTETQLTPSNVNAADFGQLYDTPLDGQVYAEPLVLTNVTITAGPNTVGTPGTYPSVVVVATQHDSLYAINAANGAILWQRTFLDTTNPNDALPGATSVTTIPSADTDSSDINPEVGITSTPVIDPSTNIIYVLPNTKEMVGGDAYYVQRLHAINVSDGTDAAPSFVIGTTTNGNTNNTPIYVNGTGDGNVNGVVQFNALRENNRPALSLVNGEVYAEWASHGDNGPYHGWVVRWDVTQLSTQGMVLSGVLCTDPNGGEGGIWGGGGGLTFDPDETFNGQPAFYFESGNGDPRGGPPTLDANGFPTDDDYYESLVKVEADPTTTVTDQNSNGWGMKIVDYFTPYNVNALDDADEDFGSGSPLVLPDSAGIPGHPHLIVAAGKEGTIYLLDRDNLGKFNINDDNVLNSVYNPSTGITTPPVLINGSLSTPAYYHGTLYWVAGYDSNAWSYVVAPNPAPDPPTVPVATIEPTSETANSDFGYLPGSVTISADGSEDPAGGIAWIMDLNNDELHAYSTLSLSTELWNSGPGSIQGVKFAVPTVANGQVFVGTQDSLQAFGLTGANTPAQPPNAPANVGAEPLSGSAIELNWTDSTVSPNFATNYAILESTDGVHFTTVANAAQESTSYTVTGLNPSTTYYFEIEGSDSSGSSGPSNIANAKTTNQTGQTPTAPQGLGATPASGSEVYLTWTNTASNETGFLLTRATDPLFTQNVITETLASAPYYDTDGTAGLSPGNTYYYELQATNSAGLSSTSNTASVNIPNVPSAPTDASAVLSDGQVVVSWTDHAGPFALGYQISRSVDGGPFTIYTDRPETSDSPPTTQTFTDTNVPPGHTYTYEIVAENVAGFSSPAYASVSVLGAANLSLDGVGNLALTVSPGVPDRLSVQLAAGLYTLTDPAVTIAVTGGGAGFVTGAGTSTVTIPAADLTAMTLDTSDDTDTIDIISDAVPITITADSGGGDPTIDLGDPTNDETISGTITNASNGPLLISGSGTTAITGNLVCQGSGGVTLTGTGTIEIAGNINLGATANLTDSSSGQDTITGVISGASTSGFAVEQGLIGTYFNLTAAQDLIQPADPSNPDWLGNQTPAVTAQLVGPIDFPDIADNGFADSVGDPAYYDLGAGINDNVEARWYGDILIPGTGTTPVPIDFATTSDDGSMLYIDGNAVVNNNNMQAATQATGLVDLTPGLHAIDVEYYQGGGAATMDVQWDPTGGTNFVDIPNSAFSAIVPANGLIKTGTGKLTLSNTDTYTGFTTVSGGTLDVTGTLSASSVTVNSGGTLDGTGTVGAITAASGGVIEPGVIDATGILDSATASLSSGSTFTVLLDGTTAGTSYDELNVTGTASLGNSTLDLLLGSNFAASATTGARYVIVGTTQGVSGIFSGLASGDTFSAGGDEFTISYTDGDNKNVVLTFDGRSTTTMVALMTGTNPAVYGTALTFEATVTSTSPPTGTVEFYDGATPLGAGSALAVTGDSATSTFTISALRAGVHAINAVYTATGSTVGIPSGNSSQTISPLAVDLTGSRVYDGTNAATSSILSVSNEVGGDDVTLSGSATLAGQDVGSQSITSFAGLTLGGTSAGDYTLSGATGSVTITPIAVTLTGSRVYNGTTTADSPILSVSNAISGDMVDVASGMATLAAKDVGSEAITSFAGLTLGGNTAGDYTLTGATGSVTITPAALSIDGVTDTKVYDGTTSSSQTPTYQVVGLGPNTLYAGDTFTTLAQAFTSKDVLGTDGSTLAISDTINDGAGGADYSVTTETARGTITPATLTASITNDPTRSYDGTTTATLSPNNFHISGLVGGESFTVSQTAGMYNSPNVASATTVTAGLTAGDFTAGTGTLASDYTFPTSASGAGSITAATATIIVTPYTVTYDTNPHTATGTATGVGGANLSDDLNLSGTTHTNAGTYNDDAWSFTDPTGNYRSASGTVNDVINSGTVNGVINQPTPTSHPVINGEQSLFLRKTNKKGRPVGKPVLAGFEFEFSSPLNPASATNSANYQVDSVIEKRLKKKVERILEPITEFNVSYINDAVTIVLARRETFKTGGQITILNSLAGASGAALAGTPVFTISKGGKGITPS